MNQQIGLLLGGYGLIVLSYTWVWCLAMPASRVQSGSAWNRLAKADARSIGIMSLLWSVIWLMGVVIQAMV
jgi:hypothetical protein